MLVLGSTRSVGFADAPVGKPKAPLGPVARDCLRAAPCPVVIVAEPSPQPKAEPARSGRSGRDLRPLGTSAAAR